MGPPREAAPGDGARSPLTAAGMAARVRAGLLVVLLAAAVPPARAGAAEDDASQFSELRTHRLWTGLADSRPVSPYLEGKFADFVFGVPFSQSYLEGNPGRSGATSSPVYGSETGEDLLELFVSGYRNPTQAISRFPDFKQENREEFAPAGENGPRARAHAPTRTHAESEVRFGPGGVAVGLGGGSARTASHYNLNDLLVEEAESAAQDVVTPGLRIGSVTSQIKVEHRLAQPPLITYRFALSDVEAGGRRIVGSGHDGLEFAGTRVPAGELAGHFDRQLTEASPSLRELAAISILLVAPDVRRLDNGGYLVTGVVLQVTRNNEGQFVLDLRNKPGTVSGLRLGYARTFSQLLSFDH